ncbi:MAG: response regulator [Armatimonadetes bacterium]|nr:response regulator [Armatimonadota bacterium]
MKDSSTPLILVIDDEPTITQALSLHFRFRGYQVEVANSGRAGLERLSHGGVDVALCDINLGDITGHQVVQTACQALADEAPEFVVMTANATLDHAIASLREGACQFVTKPWSVPYLETVVRRAVELRRLRRQVKVLEAAHQAYVLQTVEAATSNITLMAALESVLRALVVLHEPLRAAVWLLDQESGELRPVSLRLAEPGETLGPDHVAAASVAFESGEVVLRAAGDRLFSAAPIPVGGSIDGAVSMEQAGSAEMLSGSANMTGTNRHRAGSRSNRSVASTLVPSPSRK